MRVLICDAQWATRQSLQLLVKKFRKRATVIEARSIDDYLEQQDAGVGVDLAIFDPAGAGSDHADRHAETIGRLKRALGDAPIVIYSMSLARTTILRAVAAGATGFVSKTAEEDEILKALSRVLDGEIYIPIKLFRQLQDGPVGDVIHDDGQTKDENVLTPRQKEIFRLLADGRTNREISEQLGLSVGTVRVYISAILKKYGLSDRTQAALFASRMLPDGDGEPPR